MNLQSFIINRKVVGGRWSVVSLLQVVVCCSLFTVFLNAQKFAVISPAKTEVADKISSELTDKLNSLDSDLVATAFQSTTYENIFNLTTSEAKTIGSVIGSDYFVLVKADNFRRSSFVKGDYFEGFAAIYVVSSRTGNLLFWKLYSFEDKTPDAANKKLFASVNTIVTEINDNSKGKQIDKPNVLELPENDNKYRPPAPFKRLKPEYTEIASLFLVAATVDIEVDLDEKGKVTRTEIVRWAGFGLDESVNEAVRKMNWRPATKDGKALPIRVLLRYNFKKLEKAE
jgi:TonB family protein